MEILPVVGTVVVQPKRDVQPGGSRRFRRTIITVGKVTIAFVIGTIALPALIVSALIASVVVLTTGGTQLIRQIIERAGK